jgi:hypothetical protein
VRPDAEDGSCTADDALQVRPDTFQPPEESLVADLIDIIIIMIVKADASQNGNNLHAECGSDGTAIKAIYAPEQFDVSSCLLFIITAMCHEENDPARANLHWLQLTDLVFEQGTKLDSARPLPLEGRRGKHTAASPLAQRVDRVVLELSDATWIIIYRVELSPGFPFCRQFHASVDATHSRLPRYYGFVRSIMNRTREK